MPIMKANFLELGRKLFDSQRHLWLRARPHARSSATDSQRAGTWLVDVGLTSRKLENIGDVISIKPFARDRQSSNRPWPTKLGEPIAFIEWEGAAISAADELYHTVWETVIDTEVVESPVDGSVEYIYTNADEELDEDTVLLQIMTNHESIQKAFDNLLEEVMYEEYVKAIGPGKFQD